MTERIELCNVVRVERVGRELWRATVGPSPERGLSITSFNPVSAIVAVVCRAARLGWVWDEGWTDNVLTRMRRDAALNASGGAPTDG
jgi:hypothetical protein